MSLLLGSIHLGSMYVQVRTPMSMVRDDVGTGVDTHRNWQECIP